MRLSLASILCLAVQLGTALPGPPKKPAPVTPLTNHTILDPPKGGRIVYPRLAELHDGTILVTASVSGGSLMGNGKSAFPIFETKDNGVTWKWISNLTDQVNGWGMSAQPALLELRKPLGKFKPGTILASGNSWSSNGTRIDLYASTDGARTWEFISRVAEGGRPNTTNGATPIWEPFLLHYEDELIVYYSDQRDPLHGQKLAHQRSKDLLTWGPVVNDVRYDEYLARPGMTVVAHVAPIKKWILVYELPIGNSSSHGSHYPVHYRLADDPREFDAAEHVGIIVEDPATGDKMAPNASPYVVWSPVGGPNGTIIVSDADYDVLYVNRNGGDPGAWEVRESAQSAAYSRALHVFEKSPEWLMVVGGDTFDGNGWGGLSLSVQALEKKPGPGPGHGCKPPVV
ncbi:Sialidase [Chaetomidium leptoderma]|uniref:Sialidase n=1 Tax=Chaetomidium leptoderma TaxID=669021 RepID=A0AAN7A0Y5_9PEZI|nr:Sialidase [Chaetomidium leptoderma]